MRCNKILRHRRKDKQALPQPPAEHFFDKELPFEFLLLTLVVFAQSCIDSVHVSLPSDEDRLSINGQVTNLAEPYTITVKRSGTFSEDLSRRRETPVSGAELSILTSSTIYKEFTEVDPGIYQSNPAKFQGQIGESYKLRVCIDDSHIYESSWETMVAVPEIGGIDFETKAIPKLNEEENIVYHKVLQVTVDVDIFPNSSSPYIKWDVEGEYQFDEQKPLRPMQTNLTCYVRDHLPLNLVRVFDASRFIGQKIFNQPLVDLPLDYKIATAYCLHVRQQSLSAQAFHFWSEANELVRRNGNLFENSPGRIKSNIYDAGHRGESIFGFFFVSSIKEKKCFVPSHISELQPSPCPSGDAILAHACHDCLQLKNSSYVKPNYWPK